LHLFQHFAAEQRRGRLLERLQATEHQLQERCVSFPGREPSSRQQCENLACIPKTPSTAKLWGRRKAPAPKPLRPLV
jgi:hypothetical protein